MNIENAMSVDVEDYFQVSAFETAFPRESWENLPCRVEANTLRILELFEGHEIRATFFTLGWIAERYPDLIRQILDRGHELACHGYAHVRVTQQSPREFREDVRRAKSILEDLGGCEIKGYRAPSYSIGADNRWALDILEELGFQYSSSIYPVRHDRYGMPNAPRFPFRPTANRRLLEIPVSTLRLGACNFPCGGGGYFRLFPYRLSSWAIERVNSLERQPTVFYFHPWEIDPAQPRPENTSLPARFRHYLNLERTEARLERLLQDFHWSSLEEVFLNAV